MKKSLLVLLAVLGVLVLNACSGETAESNLVGGLEVLGVTLSKEQTSEGPTATTTEFYPTDVIYLTVEIKGRPKEGVVSAEAYWKDQFIASVDVDLATVNEDVLISVGENTFAFINLTPTDPWPISDNYIFAVYINDEKMGDYSFSVIPPADAIPSVLDSVTLAKDVDQNYQPIDPTTTFLANEPVTLVANGDIGRDTWFSVLWTVSGDSLVDCNTIIKADQDYPDDGLFFSCQPETGWPVGEHSVTLYMNDELVGTYAFTIE